MSKQAIGGLWKRETKTEPKKSYLSGEITLNGQKAFIRVFKNDYKKEGEKTPDYKIYQNEEMVRGPQVEQKQPTLSENDIPF